MFPNVNQSIGGTDFMQFTGGFATGTINSTTLTTVLSVTGRGFLVHAHQIPNSSGGTAASVRLQVTADGVVVMNDTSFSSIFTSSSREAEATLMFPFKNSLLVEHALSTGATATVTKLTYLLG